MTIDPAKSYSATVKTDVGTFVVALDAKTAPVTVNNFVFLAQHGFYNCVIFHRVIPTIHGSDRRSDGNRLRWPGVHHC